MCRPFVVNVTVCFPVSSVMLLRLPSWFLSLPCPSCWPRQHRSIVICHAGRAAGCRHTWLTGLRHVPVVQTSTLRTAANHALVPVDTRYGRHEGSIVPDGVWNEFVETSRFLQTEVILLVSTTTDETLQSQRTECLRSHLRTLQLVRQVSSEQNCRAQCPGFPSSPSLQGR